MKKPPLPAVIACVLFLSALISCKKDNNPPPPAVDAGPAQTIQLPDDSVLLSGKATDTSSRTTAYLWSEVSGPNVPVIDDEGSKSTLVSGLTAGTYIFQLMVVDLLGQTGVDTVSVVVKPSSADTLYLTGAAEETFLSDSTVYPNGNPASHELLAEAWTIGGISVYGRSFFQFAIPASGQGAIPVKSATLTLYSDTIPQNGDLIHANDGASNDFYIQRVGSTWDPSTTTWLNLPATDTAGRVHIPQTNSPFLNLVNIDVTTLVNHMIASGNYGFEMVLNSETAYNSRIFCSGNYPVQSRIPRLILFY